MGNWTLDDLKREIHAHEQCIKMVRRVIAQPDEYPHLRGAFEGEGGKLEIRLREQTIEELKTCLQRLQAAMEIGPAEP